tara:strand:+ start:653 stop:2173 length:1521 start_codon:yes stop_codon:yes gene_type:complete
MPFVADQAVAILAGKALNAGGTLYVDFWDNKMPGLFWFYWAAGRLFGFTEFGIHLLELIWMTGFAFVLMFGLRRYYLHSWLSAISALAVVGVYQVSAEPFQLTQIEILVGLPVFLSALLAASVGASVKGNVVRGFLSGLCAGVAVCFKLAYAPIFVGFWLVATYTLAADGFALRSKQVVWMWGAVSGGVAIVLAAVSLKFYTDGALYELYWTAFVYPPIALETAPPAPYYRLIASATYFAAYYTAWLVYIAIALVHWWRVDRRNPITLMMLAWFVIGAVLIYIQTFSWWSYHFYLLFAPAGILGVKGLDITARFLSRTAMSLGLGPVALVGILTVPCVGALLLPASQKAFNYVHVFLREHKGIKLFQETVNPKYAKIRAGTRFLNDSEARPGKIYVFGDPLYYYLSGREPAAPIVGWPWEYFLDVQFRELPGQLESSRPAYIFIDYKNAAEINERQAGVPQFVLSHYTELFDDNYGTWFGAKPGSWNKRTATISGQSGQSSDSSSR